MKPDTVVCACGRDLLTSALSPQPLSEGAQEEGTMRDAGARPQGTRILIFRVDDFISEDDIYFAWV